MSRRPALALASLLTLTLAVTACSSDDEPGPGKTSPSAKDPIAITLGVWGDQSELAAWGEIIAERNAANRTVSTTLMKWEGPEAAVAHVKTNQVPDVFMLRRADLALALEDQVSQPVAELLDERGVDFGDRFSRDALEALSAEGDLQCMPWSINTEVLYVNSQLVDFDLMKEEDMKTPSTADKWNLEEFAAAATFASRPEQKTSGVHVDASLDQLAPFILSAGGKVMNDEGTSLAFSSDETRDALEATLEVLRDASLTIPDESLADSTALDLFKEGRLGMMVGDRTLTPELREVEGLEFTVKPVPYETGARTTGDVVGLCMAANAKHPALAAGLIADLVADRSTAKVIASGRTVPANLSVANTDAFKQPEQFPTAARVFTNTLRGAWFPPLEVDWEGLDAAVAPLLQKLLSDPGTLDLDAVTAEIDAASQAFLVPVPVPADGASPTGDATPSGDASPSGKKSPSGRASKPADED